MLDKKIKIQQSYDIVPLSPLHLAKILCLKFSQFDFLFLNRYLVMGYLAIGSKEAISQKIVK